MPWHIAIFVTMTMESFAMSVNSTDGGYTDIVVYIDDDVLETNELLENIKDLTNRSSNFLLDATERRLFFKTLTIQAPKTWHKIPQLEVIGEHLQGKASILASGKDDTNIAFAFRDGGCRETGHSIHLPDSFVSLLHTDTKARFRNPAYILVHEWAHLRFGVFDESPTDPYCADNVEEHYPRWTYTDEGIDVTRWSGRLKGIFSDCSQPPNKCQVPSECKIAMGQLIGSPSQSSIMFLPYVNREEHGRLDTLKMAAIHVIRHIVKDGSQTSVVAVFEATRTLKNLTKISSSTRETLVKVVNDAQLGSATCIGCGMKEDLKALRYYNNTERGGVLLVLSDGEETREPYLRDVLPSVMKQGVTINSLEFGAEADTELRELALGTAGDSYYVSDNKGEKGFIT